MAVSYLLFVCRLFVLTANCAPPQNDISREYHELEDIIMSNNREIDPTEMYFYLTEMKELSQAYEGGPKGTATLADNLDDLIGIYELTKENCNEKTFSKVSSLLYLFEEMGVLSNLYNYVDHARSRLIGLCRSLVEEQSTMTR